MSLFNPRTDIEEKINFYFRIFDVDQDKKIKKEDLNNVMKMLFAVSKLFGHLLWQKHQAS